jgi:hypothetical protein
VIAYVDGFNLYNGLHEATGRRDLWLDLESLLTSMLDPSRGQKESDVALSVQAVEDVARGLADQVWYISGDSDPCPSVRAGRRINAGVRTVAVFPPRRSSVDLQRAVHGTMRVFDRAPSRHQLPDVVTGDGVVLRRPAHWSRRSAP